MVIVDAFTHYVALNPVPHSNAYHAYTTLYERWIVKFGLPEILVTDIETEYITKDIITLSHLSDIRPELRTSQAPWTNGLVQGMNRSLQENFRCIINRDDKKVHRMVNRRKVVSLAYISQNTITLGL